MRPNTLVPGQLKEYWTQFPNSDVAVTKFYKTNEPHGVFSNFAQFQGTPFSTPQWLTPGRPTSRRVIVRTAEQIIMLMKAFFFQDYDTFDKLADTQGDGWTCRTLGRSVKNFVETEWNGIVAAVGHHALRVKFKLESLASKLRATGTMVLVETSPGDTRWGVGLAI